MGLNAKVGAYLNIVHLQFVASQSCKDFGVTTTAKTPKSLHFVSSQSCKDFGITTTAKTPKSLHFVASQSCKDFGVLAVVVTKSKRDDYK